MNGAGGAGLVASLPMYDFPWLMTSTNTLWAALRDNLAAAGLDAPAALTRDRPLGDVWRDPGLVFGQTCGFPYRHDLADLATLLATPHYNFDGCDGPMHGSFIVARADRAGEALADFRGARAAINGRDSNTGMNLFRAALAPLALGMPMFSEVVVTGAHAASLVAVESGEVDLAAIDCVSFGLILRAAPEFGESIAVIARTPTSPALPFIAAAGLPREAHAAAREALADVLADPTLARVRADLGLIGMSVLPPQAYRRIDELETFAVGLGYPELA